ncbi:MAG: ATP-binding protein [Planctomycetota bacterium]|nr:ATP-binding protein [Planctomycetota bacterium]
MADGSARTQNVQWLTKLAGGLVHEIKNPLSTLNLNLQLLKEDWAHLEDTTAKRSLRKVDVLLKEVRRLESILNDFLRYVRGRDLTLTECDVNEIIEEILELLAPELQQKGIRLSKSLTSKLARTMLDRDLLKQALLNLIINAEQAMADGGELMIRTLESRAGIVIEITDTGRGMSPARKAKIFDPYFSTRQDGTGLGLTMTKDIVEAHGGQIFVESEETKGSRFTVGIPIRQKSEPSAESSR